MSEQRAIRLLCDVVNDLGEVAQISARHPEVADRASEVFEKVIASLDGPPTRERQLRIAIVEAITAHLKWVAEESRRVAANRRNALPNEAAATTS